MVSSAEGHADVENAEQTFLQLLCDLLLRLYYEDADLNGITSIETVYTGELLIDQGPSMRSNF